MKIEFDELLHRVIGCGRPLSVKRTRRQLLDDAHSSGWRLDTMLAECCRGDKFVFVKAYAVGLGKPTGKFNVTVTKNVFTSSRSTWL
jgi:hypothetical protein